MNEQQKKRMDEVREIIDKRLRVEMVTIGIDRDHARTGQMWAFDSERLSKIILNLKDSKGNRYLYVADEDQSLPKLLIYDPAWQSNRIAIADDMGDFIKVIKE